MNSIKKNEKGSFLRKIRKSKKKRIEDFADDNISTTTISNIETGNESVSEEKIKYYCEKLGIDYQKLPSLIRTEKEKENLRYEKIKTELTQIEHLISFNNARKGLKLLRELKDIPESLKHYVLFLKGRGYIQIDNIKKAKQFFRRAIEHVSEKPKYKHDNIHVNALNQLARLSYYQNDFEKALNYTSQGLKEFEHEGKNKYLFFVLKMNQAVYLERLGENAEAKEIIKKLLKQQDQIQNIEVVINMYDVKGSIYRKMGMYAEAVEACMKGLKLAKINKKTKRAVELWITLGSIYYDLDRLREAETCLNLALDLKTSKTKDHHIYLPAYIRLGQIYTKQGKYQDAQLVLNDAITKGKNTRIISTYIPAFVALGDCYFEQKKFSNAIEAYNSALKLARKHKLLSHEKDILYKLCLCFEKTDIKKFRKTLEKLFRVEVQLKTNKKKEVGSMFGDGDLHE